MCYADDLIFFVQIEPEIEEFKASISKTVKEENRGTPECFLEIAIEHLRIDAIILRQFTYADKLLQKAREKNKKKIASSLNAGISYQDFVKSAC